MIQAIPPPTAESPDAAFTPSLKNPAVARTPVEIYGM